MITKDRVVSSQGNRLEILTGTGIGIELCLLSVGSVRLLEWWQDSGKCVFLGYSSLDRTNCWSCLQLALDLVFI